MDCLQHYKLQLRLWILFLTLLIHNDDEGTGDAEEAGAHEDAKRHEKHEPVVTITGLTYVTVKNTTYPQPLINPAKISTSRSRLAAT